MKIIAILGIIILAFIAIGYIISGIVMCTIAWKTLHIKDKIADAVIGAMLFTIAFLCIYYAISLVAFYF